MASSMKNFKFSFEQLVQFSNSDPYSYVPEHLQFLLERLQFQEKSLNFPAINNDVGELLAFFLSGQAPKKIFFFFSGYGHRAFWYFVGAQSSLEEVVLTEKRSDLQTVFDDLPWPVNWKNRMTYVQGDAFEELDRRNDKFDLFLVDGVKADYLKFIKAALPKLSSNGIIAIDNSYWRGSFLNKDIREKKKSATSVFEMHEWIKQQRNLKAIFVPFLDGLTLIRRLN